MNIRFFLTGICYCLLLAGCAALHGGQAPTLYAQLGGETTLRAVSSNTIDAIADSPDGRRSFAQVKRPRVKARLFEFLCITADGPCRYQGDDLTRVHRGLNITEREWNALVEILRRTLEAHHVPQAASNELLKRLAPLYREIVTAGLLTARNREHYG